MPAVNVFKVPAQVPDEISAFFDPLGNAVHTTLSFDCVGEDVLITVRGKVKARLTRAAPPTGAAEMQRWADELRDLHRGVATGTHRLPSETVLGEDREDR